MARGDINLYSLFVERAMTLVKPDGTVGLLVPSGIASDKMAAPFFKSVATEGRLRALYDFENRRTRYDAAHLSSPTWTAGSSSAPSSPARHQGVTTRLSCAFFLQDCFGDRATQSGASLISAADFARVNPNTGTAPIFRSRRDAELTTEIYDRVPVLVDRSSGGAVKTWPVKYSTDVST